MKNQNITLINKGEVETSTLSECLKVDFEKLFTSTFPDATETSTKQIKAIKKLGILKRMQTTSELLVGTYGPDVFKKLSDHPSDTVRGWAAFVIGSTPDIALKMRFTRIKPFADDHHFGVREWAWMAVRPHIDKDLKASISILGKWTSAKSPRVRRFACEATRPRGVWAKHISALKQNPELGLNILESLKSDPDRYVQDSVGNWLNDAAKTQPQWVIKLTNKWLEESNNPHTAYIVKKALRSLKSKKS